MKIVVTGSKGFIGKLLVKQLLNLKHEVVEIDLSLGHDVTQWETFENIMNYDVMIHMAARIFVPESFEKPRLFYRTNILGTLNVLESCRKQNAKLIFFSSYAYGSPEYLPIDEEHPVKSFNPYSRSKIMGEDICSSYFADFGVKSVVFRPFNIFGPDQDARFLIPSIIEQSEQGRIVLRDHRPKRDYIYIDDIVSAVVLALSYNPEGSDVFNLGSGTSTSVEDVVSKVVANQSNKVEVKFLNDYRPNEVLDTVAEISKAKFLLNWVPMISFDEGLKKIMST